MLGDRFDHAQALEETRRRLAKQLAQLDEPGSTQANRLRTAIAAIEQAQQQAQQALT